MIYFYPRSWLILVIMVLSGCCVLVAEAVMCFLQSYVFVLLLRVYRNDHSL